MKTSKEETARDVLIKCREEIPTLRMQVRALQTENKFLHRQINMMLDLHEGSKIEGEWHSPDPLMDSIQQHIAKLHDENGC